MDYVAAPGFGITIAAMPPLLAMTANPPRVPAKMTIEQASKAILMPAKLRLQAKKVRIEKITKALWVQPETTGSGNQRNLAVHGASVDVQPWYAGSK